MFAKLTLLLTFIVQVVDEEEVVDVEQETETEDVLTKATTLLEAFDLEQICPLLQLDNLFKITMHALITATWLRITHGEHASSIQ
jgi:hypothetical protein